MEKYDLPMGFGMALAQNPEAIQKFAMLSEDKKRQIIDGTHSVNSRAEMKDYVNSIITKW